MLVAARADESSTAPIGGAEGEAERDDADGQSGSAVGCCGDEYVGEDDREADMAADEEADEEADKKK